MLKNKSPICSTVRTLLSSKLVVMLLILSFYFLTRLIVMFSAETLFRQGEEPYVGAIAQGMIEGWAMPPWDFVAVAHNGGSILAAIFALPLFLLLGPKILALTLTSIMLHCLGLIFLFLLADRYFNRRVAILASVFFIVSPPLFTIRSLIMNGAHTEPAVFSVLFLYIFLNIVYARTSKNHYLLLGFLSGVFLWYSYLTIVAIMTYAVMGLIKDRRFFLRKDFVGYGVSLVAGFSPWFIYNIHHNFQGLGIIKASITNMGAHQFSNILSNLSVFLRDAHKIFIFNDFSFVCGNLFNKFYYAAYLFSLLSIVMFIVKSLWGIRSLQDSVRALEVRENCFRYLFIILFPVLYVITYLLSSQRFESSGCGFVDYRYAVVLFPFIFISIAVFIDKILKRNNIFLRNGGFLILFAMIAMGVIGNGKLVYSFDFKNNYLSRPAVYYDLVGRVAAQRYGTDIVKADRFIRMIRDKNGIPWAYEGYGRSLGEHLSATEYAGRYIDLMKQATMSEEARKRFWKGAGTGVADSFYSRLSGKNPKRKDIERLFEGSGKINISGADRKYFYGGIISGLIDWHQKKYNFSEIKLYQYIEMIPPEYRYLVYMHYGYLSGLLTAEKIHHDKIVDLSPRLAADGLQKYYAGMGAGITDFFSGDIEKAAGFINRYEDPEREHLLTGMVFQFYLDTGKEENVSDGHDPLPSQYGIYYQKARALFKDAPVGS